MTELKTLKAKPAVLQKAEVPELLLAGTDFKLSSEKMRGRLALEQEKIPQMAMMILERAELEECLILSTCNRIEIYAAGADLEARAELMLNFLGLYHQIPEKSLRNMVKVLRGKAVAEHLFRVAAGIESLVIGEDQILGQVREAYRAQAQTAGKMLHRLFQKAMAVGKQARSQTGISRGKVSVGSLAVDLADGLFKGRAKPQTAVVGAGTMGYLTAKKLLQWSGKPPLIVNRDPEKGRELASLCRGEYLPYRERYAALEKAELVISTVSPKTPVFEAEKLPLSPKTGFIIDLAFPQGIEPAVAEVIPLCTIDGLKELAASELKNRRGQIQEVENLIARELAEFQNWYSKHYLK